VKREGGRKGRRVDVLSSGKEGVKRGGMGEKESKKNQKRIKKDVLDIQRKGRREGRREGGRGKGLPLASCWSLTYSHVYVLKFFVELISTIQSIRTLTFKTVTPSFRFFLLSHLFPFSPKFMFFLQKALTYAYTDSLSHVLSIAFHTSLPSLPPSFISLPWTLLPSTAATTLKALPPPLRLLPLLPPLLPLPSPFHPPFQRLGEGQR